MKNLEKLFDLVKHCESYRISTYLETGVLGYELTIYLHHDFFNHTTAILSAMAVLEMKFETSIKDTNYDNKEKMRVIKIKAKRA